MSKKPSTRSLFYIFVLIIGLILPEICLAKSAKVIDVEVDESLTSFYKQVGEGKALGDKAEGILVFPTVIKAGFGIGGEYGEGALRVKGKTVDYYNTAAASCEGATAVCLNSHRANLARRSVDGVIFTSNFGSLPGRAEATTDWARI